MDTTAHPPTLHLSGQISTWRASVIEQQFVQVGDRRVFVRAAGQGPALVLLHQSPQNGRAMLPWIERWADRFAVFAPDTPGLGLSDPLPLAQPTIPDLADALSALLDALGIERALLLGVHTGAVIGARLALQAPHRVAAVLCDGLALFEPEERRLLLDAYLPPFEPLWDGTHLRWLWARLQEQHLFFPWYAKDAAHRLAYALPSVDKLHADVMDVLLAGDGYRAVYRAPFLFEQGGAGAARLQVPAWLCYRQHDVLAPHAQRLPALPPHVQLLQAESAQVDAAITQALGDRAPQASTLDAAAAMARAASGSQRLLSSGVVLHVRAGAAQRVEVVLPDIGVGLSGLGHAVDGATRVIVEGLGRGGGDAPALQAALDEVAAAFAPAPLVIEAEGATCGLAQAWAQRLGPRCSALTLQRALRPTSAAAERLLAGLPDLAPRAAGAHLLEAWDWARLRGLGAPGHPGHAAAGLTRGAPPPRRVHDDLLQMLQLGSQHTALWRSALASAQRLAAAT